MPRRPRKHLPDGTINPLWRPVKSGRLRKPVLLLDPRAQALASFPFKCVSCDCLVEDRQLFCSDLCREEAKYVRYYRARIEDGTVVDEDVREVLRFRLAHILAGGYEGNFRQLPPAARKFVIERDKGLCRSCSAPGREVDHVSDRSSDPANLQLLCSECHRKKTRGQLVRTPQKSTRKSGQEPRP